MVSIFKDESSENEQIHNYFFLDKQLKEFLIDLNNVTAVHNQILHKKRHNEEIPLMDLESAECL